MNSNKEHNKNKHIKHENKRKTEYNLPCPLLICVCTENIYHIYTYIICVQRMIVYVHSTTGATFLSFSSVLQDGCAIVRRLADPIKIAHTHKHQAPRY